MPTECTPKLFEFEAVERRSRVRGKVGQVVGIGMSSGAIWMA
jgi:hypothetical protein